MDRMNVKKELSKRAQSEKSYWPHLVGKRGVEAVTAIKAEKPSLKVVTVLEGSMVTMDHREDRVRVYVDEAGVVARVPRIG